jgi:predicted site-specific integrase-resolvase
MTKHFTQRDLARRWSMSERTLESWRWKGAGPVYLRLGGRVLYRLEDVETYEASNARDPAAKALPASR